jgi:hypothetical protein
MIIKKKKKKIQRQGSLASTARLEALVLFDIFLMDTLHGCMHADYVKVKFIYRYKAEISLLC